ncbi:(R)-stereoselective amidase [Ascidiaceihabitans donghaensis]|uniref:(R)-stereoselective amidase n=2 Tax=Ascidiaceihabitans donghaensis TaxID=1510460 RepID=A0A2R8BB75_9RHOB|nr:(R)-stereoselective amidase [Ascidiaceihabitans donghaensis]
MDIGLNLGQAESKLENAMKIATAAYPLDVFDHWDQYVSKLTGWVKEAAGQGADLLVFPEYAAMELATLAGMNAAGDLEQSMHAVSERLPDADALHAKLATQFDVHILAGSAPSFHAPRPENGRPVNRTRLFTPQGGIGVQDKQIMTRFEAEVWDVVPGNALQIFDTALGKIGVLICYDSEFPLLGRALSQADIIVVPSVTEAASGYWRVRIGAMARALENQCITVMSSIVGGADWNDALGSTIGAGGVFCPPDRGFPETGVLAVGELNVAGWTYAEVDLAQIAEVRADGVVLNRRDWDAQIGRDAAVTNTSLQ